jgi:putative transposase
MPHKSRFHVAGIPVHVVQRGNNRQAVFGDGQDYRAYLGWLKEGAQSYCCAIHAYVLMTNHVHLLLTPEKEDGIGRLQQYLGRRFASYRYIELNPVRAGMLEGPVRYRWSSYHRNALGGADPMVVSHERYRALGGSEAERQQTYRGLFGVHVDAGQSKQIREAWQTGTPLGNNRFKEQVEGNAGTQSRSEARRGRPKMESIEDKALTQARPLTLLDGRRSKLGQIL